MNTQVEEILLGVVRRHCPPEKQAAVTLDTRLEATGIDSLSMSEIIFELEDIFGCPMPDPQPGIAAEFPTIRALHDGIVQVLPGGPDSSLG